MSDNYSLKPIKVVYITWKIPAMNIIINIIKYPHFTITTLSI